jgi:AcrR family transcriptional regulator
MSKTVSNKENILKEAAVLFSQKGYERTSMREIAKRVGVTKPAIYYHFSNKQELFEELINMSFKNSQERIAEIANNNHDALKKLEQLALGTISSLKKNPDGARFVYDLMSGNIRKNIKLDHGKVFSKQKKFFEQILNEGKEQGVIKKDLDTTTFTMIYFGTLNMYTIGYLKGGLSDINVENIDRIIDILINGIKN